MCYRVVLPTIEEILEKYNIKTLKFDVSNIKFGKDVFPQDICPVITTQDNKNELVPMQWGLIPFWSKDPKIGKKLYNARVETVDIKPAFRKASKNKCILPAIGFYEKDMENKPKLYTFNNKQISLSGIYDTWNDRKTFAILTTQSNDQIQNIHGRMPVLV